MKVLPWKKTNGDLALRTDLDTFLEEAMQPFDLGFRNRLAEMFQTTRNFPPMNVCETSDHFVVSLELPGMDAKDVNVELVGNTLQISGERKWEEEKKGKDYRRVESQYGTFTRNVVLPDNLRHDKESIEATLTKGILEVRVPKVEPTPAAKIPVKAQ